MFYLAISLMAFGLSMQSLATDPDARAYCEDTAKVMQLDGEKAAAYIKTCIEGKLEEEAEE